MSCEEREGGNGSGRRQGNVDGIVIHKTTNEQPFGCNVISLVSSRTYRKR